LDVDVERLGNVDAAVGTLRRIVELAQRGMPGTGVVPSIGALLCRAGERLEHFDVERRVELLEHHRQGSAHDAGADQDDIGLGGGAVLDHASLPRRAAVSYHGATESSSSAANLNFAHTPFTAPCGLLRSVEGRARSHMTKVRKEADSLGEVEVPADKLWGAQTQRSLEHFSIGTDLMPREMITAYAILKKAAANANHAGKRLDSKLHKLTVQVCDEILAGQHHDMFPLHVWMTGSGTQFNMNVNEVISNRCSQIAGTPLGSKTPVHPNDHVKLSESSNDTFPSAMYIAAAVNVTKRLMPAVDALHDAIAAKAAEWEDIVKIGRTHMQDATPITLGQEWSGYAAMLA